ncbi:membrane protein [Neisseria gonorrhoeae MU_NG6]|nr:membrane protein [Neisseria gonorrhoeae MU_NG1]KLS88193.1 membrane protein [Neisseria gonorrhoeae MU_NG6]
MPSEAVSGGIPFGFAPPSDMLNLRPYRPSFATVSLFDLNGKTMSPTLPPMSGKLMAVLMAVLVALMPFSIDAYLPAIPEMAQPLNADIHRIE